MGWSRFPNRLNFRAALPLEDGLWLASLSGLAHIDWESGEWTQYTESDGLGDNVLVSLAAEGEFLWIGTQNGVSRFHRESGEWRNYSTDDGLSSNYNVHVYTDGETVWAGTNNGLSWYDPAADAWESLYTAAGVELAGVDHLLSDGEALWVSVAPQENLPGGLLRMDRVSGEWTLASQPAGGPPFGSFTLTQSEETLWALPQEGLPWEYDKETAVWRPMTEIAPDGLEQGDSYQGAQFYDGALWLSSSTSAELIRYDPDRRRGNHYPAEPLLALDLQGQIVGHDETLWFTSAHGLLSFDLATGLWQPVGEAPRAIYRILGEQAGALLVNSDAGPGFWEPDSSHWEPLALIGEGEWRSPDGAALERDGTSIWLIKFQPAADERPHLLYYSEPAAAPQQFELSFPAGWTAYRLLPQSVGNTLWFVGDRGFLSYNPAVDQWGVFELAGASLSLRHVQLLGGTVWFITDFDLGQFDTATGTFSLIPLPIPSFSHGALAVTAEALWLLVDGAFFWRAPDGVEWTMVNITAPCLAEATELIYWKNALWMGGAAGVGSVEPPASAWLCYSPADGMFDTEFEALFPLPEALWFSHPWYGLWRYTPVIYE
jgi:hypothetical protein